MAIHGAAPCPPAVKRAMIDWWGPILMEYYSGSEGVGLTLIGPRHDCAAAPRLGGPRAQGRAARRRRRARTLPRRQTGLVCFSGIAPFAYHKAPEKTAARTAAAGLADLRRHRPRRRRRLPLS
jgi:long-chain acyl-CoA synthetase